MIKRAVTVLVLLLVAVVAGVAQSQITNEKDIPKPLTRILFVFDASQSMTGRWASDTKFNIATRLFSNLLDSLHDTPKLEVALRLYGHQRHYPPGDCYDTKLEVPFSNDNISRIKKVLRGISPKGISPIAFSLSEAATDFPPCDNCRNIVILITDGIEECDGDPCLVSAELQRQGIILKPFIVGIGRNFKEQFECVGTYFDARDEDEFRAALKVIISRALNPTTMQVNLLDIWGGATETNINMTLYDHVSGKVKYNLVHAMNAKGVPDTLEIDPLVIYDIVVHTIPPVRKDSIRLTSGIHNVVGIDAPQGFLAFRAVTNATLKNMPCIIRKTGSHETINVQQFDQVEKYLTGRYNAEILCLPRIVVDNIEIRQNHTTTVEIPRPGIAVVQTTTNGYGSLYLVNKEGLTWLYNMKDSPAHMETLYLQPGDYTVVFRSKYSTKTFYTIEKKFTVNPGQTTNVRLYE
ncbi:MAG: VWA domain-containing protein [Bacteroidales bacterium]|nr:VWA domain-containing protein [Bacteroidales bacterium]